MCVSLKHSMAVVKVLLLVVVRGTEVRCPEGMYINGDCASTGRCEPCAACPIGQALSGKQQDFEARRAPTHSAADCVRCKPGQWSAAGSGECHACGVGRAVRECASCPAPKVGLCAACQPGKWSAVGAETCTACPGGRFSASKLCTLGGLECCHRCPRGKHAPEGRGGPERRDLEQPEEPVDWKLRHGDQTPLEPSWPHCDLTISNTVPE